MKRAKGGKVLKRVKVAKKTMRKGSGLADLMGRALAARSAGAGTPPMAPPTGPDMGAGAPPMGMPGMKKGGKTKKYAKGGSVTRGDGCAQRGKTKGTMITMMKGGQC